MDINEARENLQQAIDMESVGNTCKALEILNVLIQRKPAWAPALGVAGAIYYNMRRFEEAAQYFRAVTVASPKKETPSLGLFHSLWQLGRQEEAIREAKRFLEVEKSEDYEKILKSWEAEKIK